MNQDGSGAAPENPPVGIVAFAPGLFELAVVQFVNATLEVIIVKKRTLRQKRGIDDETWVVPARMLSW